MPLISVQYPPIYDRQIDPELWYPRHVVLFKTRLGIQFRGLSNRQVLA